MRDANKPVEKVCGMPVSRVEDDDAPERRLKCGSGNIAKDGYRKLARRPRSKYPGEITSLERADEIESPYDGSMGMPFRASDD